jgi:hypothetical protein
MTSFLKEFCIEDVAMQIGHKSIDSTMRYYQFIKKKTVLIGI